MYNLLVWESTQIEIYIENNIFFKSSKNLKVRPYTNQSDHLNSIFRTKSSVQYSLCTYYSFNFLMHNSFWVAYLSFQFTLQHNFLKLLSMWNWLYRTYRLRLCMNIRHDLKPSFLKCLVTHDTSGCVMGTICQQFKNFSS